MTTAASAVRTGILPQDHFAGVVVGPRLRRPRERRVFSQTRHDVSGTASPDCLQNGQGWCQAVAEVVFGSISSSCRPPTDVKTRRFETPMMRHQTSAIGGWKDTQWGPARTWWPQLPPETAWRAGWDRDVGRF